MKYPQTFFLLSFLVLFTGCGGEQSSPTLSDIYPGQSQLFSIGGISWKVEVPAGWELLEIPQGSSGVVLLASRGEANFALLQKAGAQFASADNILAEAARDFDRFELIQKSENQWSFKGKAMASDPLRIFAQSIKLIPETQNYLYASCTYPVESDLAADCQSILENFGAVIE